MKGEDELPKLDFMRALAGEFSALPKFVTGLIVGVKAFTFLPLVLLLPPWPWFFIADAGRFLIGIIMGTRFLLLLFKSLNEGFKLCFDDDY